MPATATQRFLVALTAPPPSGGLGMGFVLSLSFALGYSILGYIQFYHWQLAAGLLFSALWLAHRRWWPWLFVATIVARIAYGWVAHDLRGSMGPVFGHWVDPLQFFLGNIPEPFLAAAGVFALRRWNVVPGSIVDMRSIVRLHIAAVLSALAIVAKDVGYVLNDGSIADVTRSVIHDVVAIGGPDSWELLLRFAIKNFMGVFVGVLLVAPFAMWLASPLARVRSGEILRDGWRVAVPAALLFVLLGVLARSAPLAELLRLLLLVVVVVAAMRGGWRGAALATFAVSVAVAVDDHLGIGTTNPIQLQLFVAIAGAMGLMFGATIDDLCRQQQRLDEAQSRARTLAEALASAAGRNLQAEERERRRLATELHDEFGQNLTALQTHLKLAQHDFIAHGRPQLADVLLELTRTMRRNIAGVLEALRPAALDEIGLFAAIDRGLVRGMVEDAGLGFETRIEGDARLLDTLDETHRIAAYRLAQEAVTNIVRHARATRCDLRLRINRRHGQLWLFLDIRDDGIGAPGYLRPGHGLTGMRDRATALEGNLHLRDLRPGMRVHALLRQGLAQ